jgi:hypothetical protein
LVAEETIVEPSTGGTCVEIPKERWDEFKDGKLEDLVVAVAVDVNDGFAGEVVLGLGLDSK